MAIRTRRDVFAASTPASSPSRSTRPAVCSRRSPASRSRSTSRSSATTRSPTRPASTRTASSSTEQTYEIMKPETVGLQSNRLVLGKHSGRHAFARSPEGARRRRRRGRHEQGLRALQGARRPQEERLRRGPDGARRRGGDAYSGSLRAPLPERHLLEHGGAARDREAPHRRRGAARPRRRATAWSTPATRRSAKIAGHAAAARALRA